MPWRHHGTDQGEPWTPPSPAQTAPPASFLTQLASLMGSNPPSAADKPVVKQMARIGVVPGKKFNWDALNGDIQREISRGISEGGRAVRSKSTA